MDIFEFLNTSYTAYHATANVCSLLSSNGFSPLSLGEKWSLKRGGSYFTTLNGSSVVAFKVGQNNVFNICESHTDSPCFKVKGAGLVTSGGVSRLNTEKYGGGLLYTYFDRPLKIAGRLLVETKTGVKQLFATSNYNVVIPSLAVHYNPAVNDSFAVNPQVELPLLAQSEADLYKTLTDQKVLDADLFVVPATQAFVAGVNGEFLCSARLDNLTSVFTSVNALIQSAPQDIAVVACLDNEEVGSGTRQGSPDFLQSVLEQIENALSLSVEQRAAARAQGLAVSVDNGHALHPAHPEKSDPKNSVAMNGGVVIKHHPNYATDGLSAALFKRILQNSGLAFQDYYHRSDVRCGSTLGLASARRLQIKTCDIGLAQLAMHSACETLGTSDIAAMQKALCCFLSAGISGSGDQIDVL